MRKQDFYDKITSMRSDFRRQICRKLVSLRTIKKSALFFA